MELIAKENKALKQVSESGNVVYALRVTTYNPESWVEVDIAEYNDWKRKQEEEERKLAEKYGMPYKENESIKWLWWESNSKSKKIIYTKSLNIDTLRIDKININNLKN